MKITKEKLPDGLRRACTIIEGKHYTRWKDETKLIDYVRFVPYHEVGHHVYWKIHGNSGNESQKEKFANEYAKRMMQTDRLYHSDIRQ